MNHLVAKLFVLPLLNKADAILVREEFSLDYLRRNHIKTKVILGVDSAFFSDSMSGKDTVNLLVKEGIPIEHRPLVGMTVFRWKFFGRKDSGEQIKNYTDVIEQTINYLISVMGATVILFPQVVFSDRGTDDRIISLEVASRINDKEHLKVLTSDYPPEALKAMIGQMDMFIGTRMHSNIFALSGCVPVLAISYERKTSGIMRMLNMSDYVLDITDLKIDDVTNKIQKIWSTRDTIRKSLAEENKKLKDKTIQTTEIIKVV